MSYMDRRKFLENIVIASGATALTFPRPLHAHGQSRAKQSVARVARVVAISGNILYAQNEKGPLTLYASDHVRVWKGKMFRDLSVLRPGDLIMVRCRRGASGQLIATRIWANIVTFFGSITEVNDNEFRVLLNPEAPKNETRAVRFDADTIFQSSEAADLAVGRFAQTVGLLLEDGTVQATRIIVYENDRPTRMSGQPIIPREAILIPR